MPGGEMSQGTTGVNAKTYLRIGLSLVHRSFPALCRAVVPYDHGRCLITADLRTALGLGLYRYGEPYDLVGDLIRHLLGPGDVFVDGGAHVGLYTLPAASRVGPSGMVLAFEPGVFALKALRRNVALNSFGWVVIYNEALADVHEVANFTAFSGDAMAYSSLEPDENIARLARKRQTLAVPLVRLDDVVIGPLRSRLKLVKLDLEGADYRALVGARELLQETRADWLVEVAETNLARQHATVHQIVDLMRICGYRIFRPHKANNAPCISEAVDPVDPSATINLFFTKNPDRSRIAGIIVHEHAAAQTTCLEPHGSWMPQVRT
jgi:FkbM family methyltransferase